MTDLSELLAKLKAAEGPSRELDAELAKLDDLTHPVGVFGVDCPRYTASLDAITALVEGELPGWAWCINSRDTAEAAVWRIEDRVDVILQTFVGDHKGSAALALCIALVKAKQAEASNE